MRAESKTAISRIKEIKCRPKKTITISGRAVKKIGGVDIMKGKETGRRSTVREILIPKKIKEER